MIRRYHAWRLLTYFIVLWPWIVNYNPIVGKGQYVPILHGFLAGQEPLVDAFLAGMTFFALRRTESFVRKYALEGVFGPIGPWREFFDGETEEEWNASEKVREFLAKPLNPDWTTPIEHGQE